MACGRGSVAPPAGRRVRNTALRRPGSARSSAVGGGRGACTSRRGAGRTSVLLVGAAEQVLDARESRRGDVRYVAGIVWGGVEAQEGRTPYPRNNSTTSTSIASDRRSTERRLRLPLATLDATHVGAVHPDHLGERLLGEALLLAPTAQIAPKSPLEFAFHPAKRSGMLLSVYILISSGRPCKELHKHAECGILQLSGQDDGCRPQPPATTCVIT
jgi:hypothetical protein